MLRLLTSTVSEEVQYLKRRKVKELICFGCCFLAARLFLPRFIEKLLKQQRQI